MTYQHDIPDNIDADPRHCCAVLNAEAKEFEDKINSLFTEFTERTGLSLTSISFTSVPGCRGSEVFTGIKIQFGV